MLHCGILLDTAYFILGHVRMLCTLKSIILCRVSIYTYTHTYIHTYTFYPAETAKVVCYFILELSMRCTTVEAVQPWRKTLEQNKHKNKRIYLAGLQHTVWVVIVIVVRKLWALFTKRVIALFSSRTWENYTGTGVSCSQMHKHEIHDINLP